MVSSTQFLLWETGQPLKENMALLSNIVVDLSVSTIILTATVSGETDPDIVAYEGTKSSLKMDIAERSGNKTIDFPKWLYFLQALNHYRLSIRAF